LISFGIANAPGAVSDFPETVPGAFFVGNLVQFGRMQSNLADFCIILTNPMAACAMVGMKSFSAGISSEN